MKKNIWIVLLCMLASSGFAQSVSIYFEIIPEQHLLQIESNRRKDLLDMKKAGQKAVVPNRLGGKSEMTDLTDHYLKIQTSENGSFEMKLIPYQENEQAIALIKTVCAPLCDSEISFYTTTWQPLPVADFLKLPQPLDFVKPEVDQKNDAFRQAFQSIDMSLIQLTFDPKGNGVIATQSFASYLPESIGKEVKAYLNDSIQIPFIR